MANIAIFVSLLLALSVTVDAQEFNTSPDICRGFDAFCQLRDGVVVGFYGNRYALLRQSIAIGPDDDLVNGCPLGNFNFKIISINNMQTDIDPALDTAAEGVSSCVRVYFAGTPYVYILARNGRIYDASNTPVGNTPFSSPLTSNDQAITAALPNLGFPIDVAIDTGIPTTRGWYIYGLRTNPGSSVARRWYWTPPTTGTGFTFVDQGAVNADELLDLSDVNPDIALSDVGDCAAIRLNNGQVWIRCHGEDENGNRVGFSVVRQGDTQAEYTFASDGEDSVALSMDPLIGALFRGLALCSMDDDASGNNGPFMNERFDTTPFCAVCGQGASVYGTGFDPPALPRVDGTCPPAADLVGGRTGPQYDIDAIASDPQDPEIQYSFYGNRVYVHSADTNMDMDIALALRPQCRSILFPDSGALDSTVRIEAAFSPMGSNSIFLVFEDPAPGQPMFLYQRYVPADGDNMFTPQDGNVDLGPALGPLPVPGIVQMCTNAPSDLPAMNPAPLALTRVFSAFSRPSVIFNPPVDDVIFLVESAGAINPVAIIVRFMPPATFGAAGLNLAISGADLGSVANVANTIPPMPNAAVYRRGTVPPTLVVHQQASSDVFIIPDTDTVNDFFPGADVANFPDDCIGMTPTTAGAANRYTADMSFANLISPPDCPAPVG